MSRIEELRKAAQDAMDAYARMQEDVTAGKVHHNELEVEDRHLQAVLADYGRAILNEVNPDARSLETNPHVKRGLELLRQQLLDGKGQPLSNYSDALLAELDALITHYSTPAMPHVRLEIGVEEGRMGISLQKTEGLGDEYEQKYVDVIANSLGESIELIIPPHNVGYAMVRIEKGNGEIKLSKYAVCGADDHEHGEFRKAVETTTNRIYKWLVSQFKNGGKKKRFGGF